MENVSVNTIAESEYLSPAAMAERLEITRFEFLRALRDAKFSDSLEIPSSLSLSTGLARISPKKFVAEKHTYYQWKADETIAKLAEANYSVAKDYIAPAQASNQDPATILAAST
jgi:hypothetical protein